MRKIAATLAIMLAMMLASIMPALASAAEWGSWHVVRFNPYGPASVTTDAVRVKHVDNGTRCDFARLNRYDIKLVSLNTSARSCIPGRILYYH